MFVCLIFNEAQYIPYTTINVPDKESPIMRITPFSNWSEALSSVANKTTVGFEIRYSPKSNLRSFSQKSNEEISEYCLKFLQKNLKRKLIKPEKSIVIKIPDKSNINRSSILHLKNLIIIDSTNMANTTLSGLEILSKLEN